jgi:hypothetical protein
VARVKGIDSVGPVRGASGPPSSSPQSGGFFLNAADWLLSRFPGIKDHYGDWSPRKRVIIGFLLYLVILPVIPIVLGIILYLRDPENFMKSTAAKVLGGLIVLQLGAFGLIATQPSTPLDQTDRVASDQPEVTSAANSKKATVKDKDASDTTPVDQASPARKSVQSQSGSNPTSGRYFVNCDAAFGAGVFNIPRGDKSYRPALDRDDDGVACEK